MEKLVKKLVARSARNCLKLSCKRIYICASGVIFFGQKLFELEIRVGFCSASWLLAERQQEEQQKVDCAKWQRFAPAAHQREATGQLDRRIVVRGAIHSKQQDADES